MTTTDMKIRAMAKIKAANRFKRLEKDELAALVIERTLALEQELSEHKRAEQELQNYQQLLAETERLGKIGGWEYNFGTGNLTWTAEIYAIHEVDPGFAPTVANAIDFYAPDSRPAIAGALQRAVEHGEPFDLELEIITSKGRHRRVHAIGKADQALRKVYGFFQDITERKLVETVIRNEREQAQFYLDTAGIMMAALDAKGRITMINRKGCAVLGYDEQELVGSNWFEVCLPKAICVEVMGVFQQLMEGNGALVEYYENPIMTKAGEMRQIAFHNALLRDQQGSIKGILFSGDDVTDQKQAAMALREQAVQYRNLANSGLALIWTSGTDKLCDYFNDPWLRFTGRTLEQELGNGWTEGVHPEDFDGCLATYVAAFDKREPFDMEYRLRHHSGEYRWLQDVGAPNFNSAGEFVGYIGYCFDISERKKAEGDKEKLEIQLRQAQKMEAIGVLAGGIAHDFNNILGVILGYTELAREDATAGSRFIMDLDRVLTATNRAKELVKQILAFSRQTSIERVVLKVQPLVKESLKMLRASLPTTITIKEEIDPQCGPVLADPTQVHQIVMNLCTNAFHAMEKNGGVLAVTVQTMVIGPAGPTDDHPLPPGEYVELTVQDNGTGIGPDIIDKIFDPYFTTKGIGKGTGLGLSISHGIIKGYGGDITVASTLGQGTTFKVYFPVIKEEAEQALAVPATPRGQGRILFIDDEELLTELGKDTLERLGYIVTTHNNSIEALAAFLADPAGFDLVITDQTMPGMTGVDLARRMLQVRPEVPIILCTGFSQMIDEDAAKAIGIREFAFKPLTQAMIGQLIQKVLKDGADADHQS